MSARGAFRLSDGQLRGWLGALLDGGWRVVAPVVEDGILLPRPVAASEEAVLGGAGKTRWSPKEWLLPRSERLYSYRLDGAAVTLEDVRFVAAPQVLFGVRPCDAAGLVRLDGILLGETADPTWEARRGATVVVSVACTAPGAECFCTAVGGSPSGEEGSDVQLVALEEGWLLQPLSLRGQELAAAGDDGWEEATGDDLEAAREQARSAAGQISREPVPAHWGELLEAAFEHPIWERLADRCLRCGTCAYVCPSCGCFDLNHRGDAWSGAQWRSWDSCGFALFTRHASGHNPRAVQGERYRQRVLHKFGRAGGAFFRCVGCGRCTLCCPAGLDIAEAVREAATTVLEEARDGDG